MSPKRLPLLNNDTFDDWTRDFEKTQRRVPPALRVIASDTAKIQRIDHLFVTQPDISNDWRTHIRVERYIKKESGEVVSYEWYVEQAESFLRRRAAQDALRDGLANKVALGACPTTLCVWRNLPYLTLPDVAGLTLYI